MQDQVNPTDQTRENGQKPPFWLFGSFKNAFLMIFEWSSMMHIMAKLLRPFSINGSFKTAYASHGKNSKKLTRNFLDVRFSRGFHRKSEFSFYTVKCDHSRLRFPSKCAQSWKTLKKGCFWPYIANFWMIQIFPGKTAVYVSCPYSKEHSCKKAKKSLARFSVTFPDGRTDGLTDQHSQAWPQLKLRTVTL